MHIGTIHCTWVRDAQETPIVKWLIAMDRERKGFRGDGRKSQYEKREVCECTGVDV